VLVVMRVRDGCMVAESTVVPTAELDARLAATRADPDVVGADAATQVESLSAVA
jgi:hypothetical protein